MIRHRHFDRKEQFAARNARVRSKLTLVVSHKVTSRKKINDPVVLRPVVVQKDEKPVWSVRRTVETGADFQGLGKNDCKKLQQKTGIFYNMHQLFELQSSQLSPSYRQSSNRKCFDTIEEQLRRMRCHSCPTFFRKSSTSYIPSIYRTRKHDERERPHSDLTWQFNEISMKPRRCIGIHGTFARRYYAEANMSTYSTASKTPSLPTIANGDESQEEQN